MITRRHLLGAVTAAGSFFACPAVLRAQASRVLKLSHQFPGGTIDEGDPRDRIAPELVKTYGGREGHIHDLTAAHIDKGRDLARGTAWKDFAGKNARCAELLKLAEQVS